jgi:hypothetical protein
LDVKLGLEADGTACNRWNLPWQGIISVFEMLPDFSPEAGLGTRLLVFHCVLPVLVAIVIGMVIHD